MNLVRCSTSWYRALALCERAGSARGATPPTTCEAAGDLQGRWSGPPLFGDPDSFARRLALDGLAPADFPGLLGESEDSLAARLPVSPDWASRLERLYPSPSTEDSEPDALALEISPALAIAKPIVREAVDRLGDLATSLAGDSGRPSFDSRTVVGLFTPSLAARILTIWSRTLLLELNVARLEGRLAGETPQERLGEFLEGFRDPGRGRALLDEYPVLARALLEAADLWVRASGDFLAHLAADATVLDEAFASSSGLGRLREVRGGLGDLHRGGHSVLVATFDSGLALVYKPRAMGVDRLFQEWLLWSNERGADPAFRTISIVDRGDHGWSEFVEAAPCAGPDGVARFYRRQGGNLALLYALEATDLHYENLIACGEHPVLVDLEALFHPRLDRFDVSRADHLAADLLVHSVLRTGLLPQRMGASEESEGIDVSGLGAEAGQLSPMSGLDLEAEGTDEMRLVARRVPLPAGTHLPVLDGLSIDPEIHVDDLASGFEAVYRLLERHRGELLAPAGLLERAAAERVRTVLRPTSNYAVLLRESYHPDALRDALERDRVLDHLWLGVARAPRFERVFRYEHRSLRSGDIPLFLAEPRSRDLWTGDGERIPEFLHGSSLESSRDRIAGLRTADLERQLWILRSSLATKAVGGPSRIGPISQLREAGEAPARDELVACAREIADRLDSLALCGERDATWLGLVFVEAGRRWEPKPIGPDLYDGLSGVVLFLAYAARITGEARYRELALGGLATLRRHFEPGTWRAIGAFHGVGGAIYALVHLANLWDDDALLDEAETLVKEIPRLLPQDEVLDVVAGSCGALASLLVLHRERPTGPSLEVAVACGERIRERLERLERGLPWHPRLAQEKLLTGFSHGAAGLAWALLRLAAASGRPDFRRAAHTAMAHERSCYRPDVRNWSGPEFKHMSAWCHGAAGVAFGRLHSVSLEEDLPARRTMEEELEIALATTISEGFRIGNHSLCHGDLGNLDILLEAARILDSPRWREISGRVAASILDSIRRVGPVSANPMALESPGLMTGLSGVGYGLLRAASPLEVPSILALEPPTTR